MARARVDLLWLALLGMASFAAVGATTVNPDPAALLGLIDKGGIIALLLVIVVTRLTGLWYDRAYVAELRKSLAERDVQNAELRRRELESLEQSAAVAKAVAEGMHAVQQHIASRETT